MKKRLINIASLFISLSCICGMCSKEDDKNDVLGSIDYTLNGSNYSGKNAAYAAKRGTRTTSLYGATSDVSSIQIDIPDCNATGVYLSGKNGPTTILINLVASNTSYNLDLSDMNNSVTITVTELSSTKIKGSFTGKIPTLNVSPRIIAPISGSFDLNFQ